MDELSEVQEKLERIAELERSITEFILELDKLMMGPSTYERGRRIAGLVGGLQSILGTESEGT